MATRTPLVLGADGLPQQLQVGDALPGSGGTPTLVAAGATFTVALNTQTLFSEEIQLNGDLDLDGVLTEVN